jgi:hypothetical protein
MAQRPASKVAPAGDEWETVSQPSAQNSDEWETVSAPPPVNAPPATIEDKRNAVQKLLDSWTPAPVSKDQKSISQQSGALDLGRGMVAGVLSTLSHPAKALEGMAQPFVAAGMAPGGMYPTTAPTGRQEDSEANRKLQLAAQQGQIEAGKSIAEHPIYSVGGILGPALLTHAITKAVAPRPAPAIAADQTNALSSVLARTPMNDDKGFIVQDVADAIKDPLRQAAADNPDITKVALGKDPVKAYGAYQALLTKTKQGFEKAFNSVLGPERNYPVDGHAIASQLSSSDALRRMFPNEADWVDDFYARLGSVKTLGELDDVRKLLNDRVKSTYKNAAPTMEEGGKVGATRAGLDLMRQYFYFKLEEATGQDLSGLKRTEGAVMDAERAGVANGPQLTSAHQKHVEPTTPARKVAGIIKGAKVATGNFALPVAGYVADTLEGSNLQQLHSYLKRALSDLPPPTPAQAAPPPAPIPPNRPKLGPGGPGTSIQTQPGPGPRPTGSVQYPNPTGIAAPPSSAPPRGLGSMAPAPQLQSGPAAYAGPNTVNPSTARTQIAPTLAERTATPPEAPPPGTGMVVAPDGTITLPKKILAAPPKVGTIIEVGGKKMRVVKGKRGQTALEPVKTPAEMTDSYSDPNRR